MQAKNNWDSKKQKVSAVVAELETVHHIVQLFQVASRWHISYEMVLIYDSREER